MTLPLQNPNRPMHSAKRISRAATTLNRTKNRIEYEQVARFRFLYPRYWFTFWTMNGDHIDSVCHVFRPCFADAVAVAVRELKTTHAQIHYDDRDLP